MQQQRELTTMSYGRQKTGNAGGRKKSRHMAPRWRLQTFQCLSHVQLKNKLKAASQRLHKKISMQDLEHS